MQKDRVNIFIKSAKLLLAVILFVIPWGLLLWTVENAHSRQVLEKRQTVRDDLQEIAAHLQRISQPLPYCQDRLERFVRSLRYGKAAAFRATSGLKHFMQLFLFDSNGHRINLPGTTVGLKKLSEITLRLIRESQNRERIILAHEERMVKNFLGDVRAVLMLAQAPGRLIDLGDLGQRRFAGFFKGVNQNGAPLYVLAIVDRDRIPIWQLARENIARFSKRAAGAQFFALTDLAGIDEDWFDSGYPKALHKCLISKSEVESDGFLAIGNLLERRYLIGVAARYPPITSWMETNQRQVAAISLAMFLLFILILKILSNSGIPLRLQILLLVALAGASGIIVVLGFAEAWLKSREASIIRTRQQAADAILTRFDSEYQTFRKWLENQFRELGQRLARQRTNSGFQKIIDGINPLWRRWLTILLFDDAGKLRAVNHSSVPSMLDLIFGRESLNVVGQISKYAWVAKDSQYGGFKSYLPPALKTKSPTIQYGVKDFITNPKELQTSKISGKIFDRYSEFITLSSGARLALNIYLEGNFDKKVFLKSVSRRWKKTTYPTSFSFQIYGLHAQECRYGSDKKIDSRIIELLKLNDRINLTQTSIAQYSRFAGQDWLLVGRPASKLEGFNLVMAIPLSPIQLESKRLASWFHILAVLMFVFVMTAGSLFLELVLAPLQLVMSGLERLASSQFSQRVFVKTGDEIEEIANGLNNLLEEMEQLVAAEKVHRQMISKSPIIYRNIGVAAFVRAASQIGSDLADVFKTPDGRIALCLIHQPDNTISAALTLARAKTLFRLRSESQRLELSNLLKDLGQLLKKEEVEAHSQKTTAAIAILAGCIDSSQEWLELAWKGKFIIFTSNNPPHLLESEDEVRMLRFPLSTVKSLVLAPSASLAEVHKSGQTSYPSLPDEFWSLSLDRLAENAWPILHNWRPNLATHTVSLLRLEHTFGKQN